MPPPAEVRDLLLQFDKGVKAVKMYLPNNPQHRLFVSRTVQRFRDFFDAWPEARLEVRRWEIFCGGEEVYRNEDRGSSLAFVLHRDGIREIVIRRGIEDWEVEGLLQAFNRDFTREYLEDDLVTAFWEQNFGHVTYRAAEDFMDEFLPAEVARAADRGKSLVARAGLPELGEDIRQVIAPGTGGEPGGGIPLLQTHLLAGLFAPTEEERQRLGRLTREDAARSFFPLVVETVFNILSLEKDPGSVTDLIDLLGKLLDLELKKGDFRMATRFIRRLRQIAAGVPGHQPEIAARCEEFLGRLEGREFTGGMLADALVRAPDNAHDDAADFVAALPVGAARGLLELFGRLESMKLRKALIRGLASLTRDEPAAIEAGLGDGRWFVVRNTVTVLGMIGTPETVLYLDRAMRHQDVRVRREVLKAALEMSSEEAEDFLLQAVDDPDEKMRLTALKSLGHRHGEAVRRKLLSMASSADFRRRGEEERRQVYLALARVGAEEEMAFFEGLLTRRAWLGKELRREQAWAVEALRAADSPAGRDVLQAVSMSGSGAIREACRKALQASGAAAGQGT